MVKAISRFLQVTGNETSNEIFTYDQVSGRQYDYKSLILIYEKHANRKCRYRNNLELQTF